MQDSQAATIAQSLSAPFPFGEVHWKPKVVKGNRALAIAYVDAQAIQDRLDDVLGVDGWQDEYRDLPGGSIVCQLRLRIDGQWISRSDVGSPSEQSDAGDRMKAAFSDALKRAAVKFGIGRYLYRLPFTWTDYDPEAKRLAKVPQLPAALPAPSQRPSPRPASSPAPKPAPEPEPATAIASAAPAAPQSPELAKWNEVSQAALAKGVITCGTLAKWIGEFGVASVAQLGPKPIVSLTRRLQSLLAA
jgi:hypothetical protein